MECVELVVTIVLRQNLADEMADGGLGWRDVLKPRRKEHRPSDILSV